jgi:chemotaxis protein MotB
MADKCPPCKKGAPEWMATFSDMCQLLLTFFILLLSFAKTETAKYEAAMGSIRNAFGGNVLKAGDVMRPGKSPDDAPTMIESDNPPLPFPIEFLTSEGLLDKHEVNRETDGQLAQMKSMLKDNGLEENVDVYEMPESLQVRLKDRIFFRKGDVAIEAVDTQVLERLVKMMRENPWHLTVQGHAEKGEVASDGTDAFSLSSRRAIAVSRLLMARGVPAERMSTTFYGDSRPQPNGGPGVTDRRVEFMVRKSDPRQEGKKVNAQ